MDRMAQRHRRGGLYLESTEAEQLGVLPGEERRVGEVMDRRLVSIAPASNLAQATEIMQQRQVTSLIVGDKAAPIGLLTERDLARQLACAAPQRASTVGEAMGGQRPIACQEDDILADALSAMRERNLSALPVVNRRGIVVGILSPLEVTSAPARNEETPPDPPSPSDTARKG